MSKRIEIEIDKDGNITSETKGFTGRTCKDASKWVDMLLGQVTSDKNTPEFFGRTTTTNKQHEQA